MKALPCACCAREVRIRDRSRFLRMVRERRQPLCEQCRRYVRGGVARIAQVPGEHDDPKLFLVRGRGKHARKRKALASQPLARVCATACEAGVAVDE